MAHRDPSVSELCRELGIRPVRLYYRSDRRCLAAAGLEAVGKALFQSVDRAWETLTGRPFDAPGWSWP